MSFTDVRVPVLGVVGFTTDGSSTVWTSEGGFQFLLVVFVEVVWVKGFLVVCSVGLPSRVCLCWCFRSIGLMKCF